MEQNIKKAYEDLDPLKVYQILQRIRDEDIILFDMDPTICRPIDMIITQLPAPPVSIRPSVAVS
jgi:DNA-directed RNA polymerase III subunit RPC1